MITQWYKQILHIIVPYRHLVECKNNVSVAASLLLYLFRWSPSLKQPTLLKKPASNTALGVLPFLHCVNQGALAAIIDWAYYP